LPARAQPEGTAFYFGRVAPESCDEPESCDDEDDDDPEEEDPEYEDPEDEDPPPGEYDDCPDEEPEYEEPECDDELLSVECDDPEYDPPPALPPLLWAWSEDEDEPAPPECLAAAVSCPGFRSEDPCPPPEEGLPGSPEADLPAPPVDGS